MRPAIGRELSLVSLTSSRGGLLDLFCSFSARSVRRVKSVCATDSVMADGSCRARTASCACYERNTASACSVRTYFGMRNIHSPARKGTRMTGEDGKIQPEPAKAMTRRTFYEMAGRIGVGVAFGAAALSLGASPAFAATGGFRWCRRCQSLWFIDGGNNWSLPGHPPLGPQPLPGRQRCVRPPSRCRAQGQADRLALVQELQGGLLPRPGRVGLRPVSERPERSGHPQPG